MNNTLKYILIGVAGVIIGFAISYLLVSSPISIPATGGETNYGGDLKVGVLTTSGVNSTTTGPTTVPSNPVGQTMIASDIIGYSLISVAPIATNTTLTLPASTTLTTAGFLPNAGDSIMFIWQNATGTVSTTVGLRAGTGSLLQQATTSAASATSIATTSAGEALLIRVTRKVNTDILFQVFQSH